MPGKQAITRAFIGLVGIGLLAIPVVAVGLSGSAASDRLWTALRLAALEGLTLIFTSITLGSLRPLFRYSIRPRALHRLHVGTGVAGFLLVISHATMLLIFGLSGYERGFLWLGLTMLVALVLTILTAVRRLTLRRFWRWIHRLNYVVFAAGLVHGFSLGSDFAAALWLKIWFLVYAAVVACGLIYRIRILRPQFKR